MHKPKILKHLEKLALHFVLDEDVKRQNLLFENRCCYLKSNPLRTDPPHYKHDYKNYKHYWHYSSLPPFLPSFPSSRFKPQGSQSSLLRRPRRPTSRSLTPRLNEKITTRREKEPFQRKYSVFQINFAFSANEFEAQSGVPLIFL